MDEIRTWFGRWFGGWFGEWRFSDAVAVVLIIGVAALLGSFLQRARSAGAERRRQENDRDLFD